jgi:hypothetical protein
VKAGDRVEYWGGCTGHIPQWVGYKATVVVAHSSTTKIKWDRVPKGSRGEDLVSTSNLRVLAPALDLTKPVQTKMGASVRILCKDRKGAHPVVGLMVRGVKEEEQTMFWKLDGTSCLHHDFDLVNVPPPKVKKETWLLLCSAGGEIIHFLSPTGEPALKSTKVLAKKKVTIEEGEGMNCTWAEGCHCGGNCKCK